MTFSLSILINLKDKLWLAIIKEGFLNTEPPANLESDIGNLTAPSSYKRKKVETMLGFVDKDRLAYMAWARIQKKTIKAKNA